MDSTGETMSESGTAGQISGSVGDDEIGVLLVDDNEAWVQSTGQILSQQVESFTVTTATDLARASNIFDTAEHDCVVCDYDLGTATGLELLSEVRKANSDLPFILITGQGNESIASEAITQEVTDYIPKRSLGGNNEILASRIVNTVDAYRTEKALVRERRNKEAMLDILTATSSQEDLIQQFCDHLVSERDYDCAWIGTTGRSNSIVPRASANAGQYLDAAIDSGTAPGETTEPAVAALEEEKPHVRTNISESTEEDWETAAIDHGFKSAAAVPLTHDESVFGVLAIYKSAAVIDATECSLLEEYGETVGYALRSTNWKEALLSAAPVAIEFEITDQSTPLVAVGRKLPPDSNIEILTSLVREETLLYVARISNVTAEQLTETAAAVDVLELNTLTETKNQLRCELAVSPPTPETVIAEHGGKVVEMTVDRGRLHLTVHQNEDSIQPLVDALDSAYPTTVWAVRSANTTKHDVTSADLLDSLTKKQRQALELAYFNGYFKRPREHDTTEVAEKLGVTRQTLTQHLRAGQNKLLGRLLDPAQ